MPAQVPEPNCSSQGSEEACSPEPDQVLPAQRVYDHRDRVYPTAMSENEPKYKSTCESWDMAPGTELVWTQTYPSHLSALKETCAEPVLLRGWTRHNFSWRTSRSLVKQARLKSFWRHELRKRDANTATKQSTLAPH